MGTYSRPNGGWRYKFDGMNTKEAPDGLSPTKYPIAVNVRGNADRSVRTRPGYALLSSTIAHPITDIRGYAALGTDNLPRFLYRNSINQVYLDSGSLVATLGGSAQGVSFIPFRPNSSPQAWMYVGAAGDYKKISAPDSLNAVTVQEVGIEEPQSPPQAAPNILDYTDFTNLAANWTNGGTAGAPVDAAYTETAVDAKLDPASVSRYSIRVTSTAPAIYARGKTIKIGKSTGGTFSTIIEDVIPAISNQALTVQSIMYYAGTTGRCVVVPTQIPRSSSSPVIVDGAPVAASIYDPAVLGTLRRGALVAIGGETCLVLSSTVGPNGQISFEVITTGTRAAGNAIVGYTTLVVSNISAVVIGQTITSPVLIDIMGAGTGTLVQAYAAAANPFVLALGPSANTPQSSDYLFFSILFDDLSLFTKGRITFDVNSGGAADFLTNAFYYEFTPSSLLGGFVESFPTGDKWFTIGIPLTQLIHIGTDNTKTLTDFQAVQISIDSTGAGVTFTYGSFAIAGGGQPDVGDTGSPYFYLARGRSSLTGAKSNPSPVSRYGVSPRRQSVRVSLVDSVVDTQMDTWDIFRYGGAVTSFRYIGSMPNTGGGTDVFTDNFFDTSARGGSLIEYDNFQPWPSVDLPYIATAGTVGGVLTTVIVTGTNMLVIYSAAAPFTNPAPANILSWLPGTLVILGGQSAYTLWNRPTLVTLASPPTANYYAYLFQFVENVGNPTVASVTINEPFVAGVYLPYLWGPDAQGTVFGCGDPLRPGSIYFAKNNQPDSAPDTYNQEITNPSEPLLGGETKDGLSYTASASRWFGLYPQASNLAQRYQVVEKPVGRGLAAPFGHCTDGTYIYFWAKDGIWMFSDGEGESLTDEDLYNLFPHEGVVGTDVTYANVTVHAPDYARAVTFRLAYHNSFLYADYQDSTGTQRTLVLDMRRDETGARRRAWCVDSYGHAITVHYGVDQADSSLLTSGTLYPSLLLGDTLGRVYQQQAFHNDNTTAIACALATFEYNCGDDRQSNFVGDHFLSALSSAQITATPYSEGNPLAAPTVLPISMGRISEPISIGGGLLANFIGLVTTWADNFLTQAVATEMYIFQPSFVPKNETTQDRFTDWDDAGVPDAKYFQGFILEADTFNTPKSLLFRNGDNNVAQQSISVTFNGQQKRAYSFDTPFIAHNIRVEPDGINWILYGFKWIYQPTPESVTTWKTQGTAFGLTGYVYIRKIVAAYISTDPVTLNATAYDGTSIQPLILPSTGGAYRKTVFNPTYNKGQLFSFSAVCPTGWRPFFRDWEIHVGQWGRSGPCIIYRNIGGDHGDKAEI